MINHITLCSLQFLNSFFLNYRHSQPTTNLSNITLMFDLEYSFCICIVYMNMDGDILKRLFDPNSKRSLVHFLFHILRRLLDYLDGYTEIITTQNSAACDHDHFSCLCDYFRRVCCSYCVRVESRTRQEYGSFVHAGCYKSKTFLTYTLPVAKS